MRAYLTNNIGKQFSAMDAGLDGANDDYHYTLFAVVNHQGMVNLMLVGII